MRVLKLESGNFRAIHRPEAPSFGAFWHLARVKVRGEDRLRKMNRSESGIGWNQAVWSRSNDCEGSAGRCSGGQAEMSEDLGNHDEIFDGGDDLQDAATLGTLDIIVALTGCHRTTQSTRFLRRVLQHYGLDSGNWEERTTKRPQLEK
jgi:hypothetical protein